MDLKAVLERQVPNAKLVRHTLQEAQKIFQNVSWSSPPFCRLVVYECSHSASRVSISIGILHESSNSAPKNVPA